MPIAPTFRSWPPPGQPQTQTPLRPSTRAGCTPKSAHARISASSMRPHVGDDVDRLAERDDRVPDELAGAVPGDLAAAVDVDHRRARIAGRPVQRAGPLARGVDRLVLQQQAGVGDVAAPRAARAAPAAGPRRPGTEPPRRRTRPGRRSAHRPRRQPKPPRARERRRGCGGGWPLADGGIHEGTSRAGAGGRAPEPWHQIPGALGMYRVREAGGVIDETELRRMSQHERSAAAARARRPGRPAAHADPRADRRRRRGPGGDHRLLRGAGRLDRGARRRRCPATTARAAGAGPGSASTSRCWRRSPPPAGRPGGAGRC